MSLSQRKLAKLWVKACKLHHAGDLDQALALYGRVRGAIPFPKEIPNDAVKAAETLMKLSVKYPMAPMLVHNLAVAARQRHSASRQLSSGATTEEIEKFGRLAMYYMSLAVLCDPTNAIVLHNLGVFHNGRNEWNEALWCLWAATRQMPELGESYRVAGNILGTKGNVAGMMDAFEKSKACPVKGGDDEYGRALLLLSLGEYEEGWRLHESRWKTVEFNYGYRRPDVRGPRWAGEPLDGRTLYVHGEQGAGDVIQFGRFVAGIEGGTVIVEVLESLVPLFQASFPRLTVVKRGDPPPEHDLNVPMMSLPWAFRTTIDTVPAPLPVPAIEDRALWRTIRDAPGLKVGIAWAGSRAHPNDSTRSMPDELLGRLAGTPGVTFVNLQVGERADAFTRLGDGQLDITPQLTTYLDTAAALQALDLVITVDTSVAHLAGSCGVPTWICLPIHSEWRWMIGRRDTPWYPTATLWRQTKPNDWSTVLDPMREQLTTGLLTEAA